MSVAQANVRQEPTTESPQVGTLPEGTRIAVLCTLPGEEVSFYGTDRWYRLEFEGGVAYILSVLVALDGEVPACEQTEG